MSGKTIIIGSIIFLVILIGGVFFLSGNQKPVTAEVKYSQNDTDRPKAQVDNKFTNIGDMSVSDEKSTDFTLKNVGTKPLQILDVTSSCHCTFGQIIYGGKESEKFSMNGSPDVVAEIAPGDSATVRVIYIPSIMPVSGVIEREVYVSTNDPSNQKLVFSIQANVK